MYESDLYQKAKSALENNLSIRQAFKALPPATELSVSLEGRIPCTLTCHEDHVELAPRKASTADIEITLFSESIRRLAECPLDDLMQLSKEMTGLSLAGYAKFQLLTTPKNLYEKGYLRSLQGLGPELQKDFSKYLFSLMGHAAQAVETVKTLLKR